MDTYIFSSDRTIVGQHFVGLVEVQMQMFTVVRIII